ncbi:MAG: DUF3667 domain-containing protein [Saprospiraceae bacterium]|nr:DUF3667 domain-containing protein [Saprospiraceae bacterium]HMS69636.1 DUF3667 domain-containing protein [Saprospiraceae bacterium]
MASKKPDPKHNYCLNCQQPYAGQEEFCSNCGQHRLSSDLSAKHIFNELFSNIFNFNSRFFRTIKNIYRPHFLTKEYIAGRRKSYFLPTQTFLFSIFLLFALFMYFLPNLDQLAKNSSTLRGESAVKRAQFDTLVVKYMNDTAAIRKMRSEMFGDTKDSIFEFTSISDVLKKVSLQDIYYKSADSIIKEKHITSWLDKLVLKQYMKYIFNPIGSTKFLINNLSWAFIINTILMSMFAKLVYWRHKHYFIEHLTFNLYVHSGLFLMMSILILMNSIIPESWISSDTLGGMGSTFAILYVPVSIRLFYKDSWFKYFLRLSVLLIAYVFIYCMCVLFVSAISLLFI